MSKKIMFNDKYGLTKAVLEGRKTQTRRIIKDIKGISFRYKVGEIVAIAQAYKYCKNYLQRICLEATAGFDNKMFVKAELMPHHIRITDVRVERLSDICSEDCIAEGIYRRDDVLDAKLKEVVAYTFPNSTRNWLTPKEAYSALIDKISGKGTWDANPFVFVYEFELVD